MLLRTLYRSAVLTLIFTVLLGGIYPLAVWGVARLFFADRADGGFVKNAAGRIVGARLLGQNFTAPKYFHGRPSAAGEKGYDATASAGSNLGPTSEKLHRAWRANVERLVAENLGATRGQIPGDLITASASGLDPDISPAGAYLQTARVAAARGVSEPRIRAVVDAHVQARTLGFLGEPVVNVLELNLAIDGMQPEVK